MVKPWIFEFFRAPQDEGVLVLKPRANATVEDAKENFAFYWDMWTKAESYGLEGIFFSEHHFGPGYSPSPNLLIAALAPLTKTLRLGVMGVVLPYYQPWRVIEEAGMLDHLTNGRLEFGTASGIPPEMAQVGLGPAEAAERNTEAQDIIDWALTHPGEPITHHGKYWNVDKLVLVPPPLQNPIPRWTTVVSEASARRAGRRGTKICSGFRTVADLKTVFGGYLEEADKAGFKVDSDWIGVRRVTTISPDGDEARQISSDYFKSMSAFFAAAAANQASHAPVPDAAKKPQGGGSLLSADDYVAGTPMEVAEQIIEQCRALGAGHFVALLDGHGGRAKNLRAYELYCTEVVPILRRANVELTVRRKETSIA